MSLHNTLADATWECVAVQSSGTANPLACRELPTDGWIPIEVPGTAAAALRRAGRPFQDRDYDDEDWWFRTRFARPEGSGPWMLALDGLATIADVWLNDQHLLHSENMFQAHRLEVSGFTDDNELLIRCAGLHPSLSKRKPRPRWKVARLQHRGLRWIRTSLLGRLDGWPHTPPAVGPWRPIRLIQSPAVELVERDLRAVCDGAGAGGSVTVTCTIRGPLDPDAARLVVAGQAAPLALHRADNTSDDLWIGSGTVALEEVERWWPHTHGAQPRYPVILEIGDARIGLGDVGFRTIAVDRADGGFALVVNGVKIFARGACWTPVDPVGFSPSRDDQRRGLLELRDANLNIVRVSGDTAYEDDDFLDLCDELGLLLWQDCMLAFYDPPEDPDWSASFRAELDQQFRRLQGHPSVAVISGGSEIEQQATYAGRGVDGISALDTLIPDALKTRLPQIPYVTSSPTGGDTPTRPDTGVAHYYGVGAYLRDLDDARRSGVRFAAECLALATPSEPRTIDEVFGGPARAGHHPEWKRSVYRDAGASWDFEDVRNHYTRQLFGVEPDQLRYYDAERALELGRATVAELFSATLSEWRRSDSPMSGAVVFHLRDLLAGAGLGIIDAHARPKAPWYVMRRLMAPVAVMLTDEGLNGLAAHVVNDAGERFDGVLRAELFSGGELCVDHAEVPVSIDPRDGHTVTIDDMFPGFRDLTWAHKFGPVAYDVVGVTLLDTGEEPVSRTAYLPGGPARNREHDLGLTTTLTPAGDDWTLTVESRRFAQWVSLDLAGWHPDDSWFHLLPGRPHSLALHPLHPEGTTQTAPSGYVRALNSTLEYRLVVDG